MRYLQLTDLLYLQYQCMKYQSTCIPEHRWSILECYLLADIHSNFLSNYEKLAIFALQKEIAK